MWNILWQEKGLSAHDTSKIKGTVLYLGCGGSYTSVKKLYEMYTLIEFYCM